MFSNKIKSKVTGGLFFTDLTSFQKAVLNVDFCKFLCTEGGFAVNGHKRPYSLASSILCSFLHILF